MDKIKSQWVLFLLALVVCLPLGMLGSQAWSQGQEREAKSVAETKVVPAKGLVENGLDNGRYQLIGVSSSSAYFLDTRTGRLWYRDRDRTMEWKEETPPILIR